MAHFLLFYVFGFTAVIFADDILSALEYDPKCNLKIFAQKLYFVLGQNPDLVAIFNSQWPSENANVLAEKYEILHQKFSNVFIALNNLFAEFH
jgi:hypothetical protein